MVVALTSTMRTTIRTGEVTGVWGHVWEQPTLDHPNATFFRVRRRFIKKSWWAAGFIFSLAETHGTPASFKIIKTNKPRIPQLRETFDVFSKSFYAADVKLHVFRKNVILLVGTAMYEKRADLSIFRYS